MTNALAIRGALVKTGVKVGPGDALFVRAGVWARRKALGPYAGGRNGRRTRPSSPERGRRWIRSGTAMPAAGTPAARSAGEPARHGTGSP